MNVGVTVGNSVERLEATAESFAFAELSIGESSYVPTEEADSRLRATLGAVDAELCVHLPFEQVVSTPVRQLNDAIVAHLAELLDWAGTLGAQKAVLHGTMRDPHDVDQRQVFADQLSAIARAGDDAGVELVVENVGHQARGLPLSVLGDIARETETAVCFDVGHAYMEEGNDGIERFLDDYADLVSHLHVHDARRRGDTHIPIGAGEVEYELVADPLSDFDGTIAVEVFTDDVPLLRDSAERARTHLQQSHGSLSTNK
ncbi:sugar phosphate isomerase/epimerase family protein [Haloarcula amylovorans]|uniref:sugar phosphate isomerase/epimerase family protein n=1 Tax=Haloarcula amylovorans TaxID=2562280 RepID=UPI001076AA32|nr:TIM barrel protein [Halomicroarcula amylolytica]